MKVIYPPCKKCGASHGMGMKDTLTGEIEPIDICKDCLFTEWRENMRCMTSDGIKNSAEELNHLEMSEELNRLEKELLSGKED